SRPALSHNLGYKVGALPGPSGASAWERTPVRMWRGNLATRALVQRTYGRIEHCRGWNNETFEPRKVTAPAIREHVPFAPSRRGISRTACLAPRAAGRLPIASTGSYD